MVQAALAVRVAHGPRVLAGIRACVAARLRVAPPERGGAAPAAGVSAGRIRRSEPYCVSWRLRRTLGFVESRFLAQVTVCCGWPARVQARTKVARLVASRGAAARPPRRPKTLAPHRLNTPSTAARAPRVAPSSHAPAKRDKLRPPCRCGSSPHERPVTGAQTEDVAVVIAPSSPRRVRRVRSARHPRPSRHDPGR